jgi:tetratricopeptide (TPR) repeat protein
MPPDVIEEKGSQASKPTFGQRLRALAGAPRRFLAWAMSDWIKASLAVAACLASIGAVVILWLSVGVKAPEPPKKVEPEEVLQALDEGRFEEARRLAVTLPGQGELPADFWGLPAYAQGVAAFQAAELATSGGKKERYLVAARHLEEARDRGFPEGHENEGLFLLGKSLCYSEQYTASQAVLKEALKVNPHRKAEIHGLLASVDLNLPNPLLDQALEHNKVVLADKRLPADMRRDALLEQAQILLRMGRREEAEKVLTGLPAEAEKRADVLLLRGWMLMEQAQSLRKKDPQASQTDAQAKYQAAIETLRRVVKHDSMAVEPRCQAMYLIGVCFQQSGDVRRALDQFYRTYCDYADSPEAMAASFQSAELNRQAGQQNEAMAGYRRVLTAIKDADNYNNPWLPIEELRRRIMDVYQAYFNRQNYRAAMQLAGLLLPLYPEARVVALKAETYQAWGRRRLAEAASLPPSQAEPVIRNGRQLLRAAGKAYQRLAELHLLTREYSDDLWASAESLLEGQDFATAAQVLREYLKNEARRRYPQALVHLGEALLAMGRLDDALEAFNECINFYSRDAASFRARLLASQAYMEKGDRKEARRLLDENLNGDFLAPSSAEWRDSLFALGRLLYGEGQYNEAINRLEEAVARYPDCPQAVEGRYYIAEGYRLSARQMRMQIEKDASESVRQAYQRQVTQLFESALKQYEQLESQLSRRQRTGELNTLEKAILRNCSFSIGAVLFDLERYDAAVKAYAVACNRYQNSPEVLEAYLQLARTYRRLDKPNEARSALDQAKVALARMNAERRFSETTNHSKEQWAALLDWAANTVSQPKEGS